MIKNVVSFSNESNISKYPKMKAQLSLYNEVVK